MASIPSPTPIEPPYLLNHQKALYKKISQSKSHKIMIVTPTNFGKTTVALSYLLWPLSSTKITILSVSYPNIKNILNEINHFNLQSGRNILVLQGKGNVVKICKTHGIASNCKGCNKIKSGPLPALIFNTQGQIMDVEWALSNYSGYCPYSLLRKLVNTDVAEIHVMHHLFFESNLDYCYIKPKYFVGRQCFIDEIDEVVEPKEVCLSRFRIVQGHLESSGEEHGISLAYKLLNKLKTNLPYSETDPNASWERERLLSNIDRDLKYLEGNDQEEGMIVKLASMPHYYESKRFETLLNTPKPLPSPSLVYDVGSAILTALREIKDAVDELNKDLKFMKLSPSGDTPFTGYLPYDFISLPYGESDFLKGFLEILSGQDFKRTKNKPLDVGKYMKEWQSIWYKQVNKDEAGNDVGYIEVWARTISSKLLIAIENFDKVLYATATPPLYDIDAEIIADNTDPYAKEKLIVYVPKKELSNLCTLLKSNFNLYGVTTSKRRAACLQSHGSQNPNR
jgi:hypothetical protein